MAQPSAAEELLAVVRRDDDQRVVVETALLQRVEQPADARVGETDLLVVDAFEELHLLRSEARPHVPQILDALAAAEPTDGFDRIPVLRMATVFVVRVEVVHEEKEGTLVFAEFLQERQRALRHPDGRHVRVPLGLVGVEYFEALVEAVLGPDEAVTHHARGGEPRLRQPLGQRLRRSGKRRQHEVETVTVRVLPREDRRHGGLGPWGRGIGAVEAHAAFGQLFEGRRGIARVAVGAQVVRAQGVDQDQQDVPGCVALRAAARAEERRRDPECGDRQPPRRGARPLPPRAPRHVSSPHLDALRRTARGAPGPAGIPAPERPSRRSSSDPRRSARTSPARACRDRSSDP